MLCLQYQDLGSRLHWSARVASKSLSSGCMHEKSWAGGTAIQIVARHWYRKTSASIPSKPRTMLMSPVVVALPDWDICPGHGALALGGLAGFNVSTLLIYFLAFGPLWTVSNSQLRNWLRLCISLFLLHSGHQTNPSSFHTAWPAKPHSKCSRQKANRKTRVKRVKMRKWQVLDVNGWHEMTKGLRDYQRNFVQGKTRRT